MSVRVNLIRDDELRQPGVMNPKVLMRISIFSVGGILALVIVFLLIHVGAVKRALSHARADFRKLDPIFQDVRAMQQDLEYDRTLREELDTWHTARFNWHEHLKSLPGVVPPTIQMTRLTVKGTVVVIQPPAWDKKSLPVPARKWTMRLDGKAAGERGNEVVVQFVRTLRAAPGLESVLHTVQLSTGLKRTQMGTDGTVNWAFGIEATSTQEDGNSGGREAGGARAEEVEKEEEGMNIKALTKEQKQMLILGALLAFGLLFAVYQFVFVPASKTFKESKTELSDLEGKLQRAAVAVEAEATVREQLEEIASGLQHADEQFIPPRENTLSWATEFVYRNARAVGIEIETVGEDKAGGVLAGQGEKVARIFVPYAVRMVASCGYFDFVRLVESIERSNPYVCVTDVQISIQTSEPEIQRITCTLEWPMWRGKPGSEVIRFPSKKKQQEGEEAAS
jgi:hypothetical protein